MLNPLEGYRKIQKLRAERKLLGEKDPESAEITRAIRRTVLRGIVGTAILAAAGKTAWTVGENIIRKKRKERIDELRKKLENGTATVEELKEYLDSHEYREEAKSFRIQKYAKSSANGLLITNETKWREVIRGLQNPWRHACKRA